MSTPADPALASKERRPPRNIVLCLDGTNDEIGRGRPSNPAKVFEMLDLDHPGEQVAYYDPGIGTLAATTARGKIERRLSRATQLAFGAGLVDKLAEAYTWLMENYQPGDSVYVFGFSRGAYTARALVAMVGRPGLLRSGSNNLVRYAVRQYVRKRTSRRQDVKDAQDFAKDFDQDFAEAFCWGTDAHSMSGHSPYILNDQARMHSIPIEYLGIWDTVKATGFLGFGKTHWPRIDMLWNVRRLRHAMSIDERRRAYKFVPVTLRDDDTFQQAWFAGVHSDVGGTYPNHELATIALKWVFDDQACRNLLLRDCDEHTAYKHRCDVRNEFAGVKIHKLKRIWRLAGGWERRSVPDDAVLHESVRLRRQDYDHEYGPHLPDFDTPRRFTDPHWFSPRWEQGAGAPTDDGGTDMAFGLTKPLVVPESLSDADDR